LKVLPPEAMVVVDHLGEDELTASLLKRYGGMGLHIWRCTDPWRDNGKSDMLTFVMRQYKNRSKYLIPLDIDEFLAIVATDRSKSAAQTPLVRWTKQSLRTELSSLDDIDFGLIHC